VHRAIEFLEDGDRIKVTVRFRGRELTHPELGRNLIARFADRVKDHGIPERTPLLEGKSMHITMASTHKPKGHEGPVRAAEPGEARDGAAEPAGAIPAPAAAAPVAAAPAAAAPVAAAPVTAAAATPAPDAAAAPVGAAVVIPPDPAATARQASPARVAAPKPAATTEPRTATRAAAEPKTTNDKTPVPEPVRTGE
jgi:hypothetical protein